jgi:hypothetical protein
MVITVCELAMALPSYDGKVVSVRGVYYYGALRQHCEPKCKVGDWPSSIFLVGGGNWENLDIAERKLEMEAKSTGKRFELWVTVSGRLQTKLKPSALGPCVTSFPAYGGPPLGFFPAQISVQRFTDIEPRENPQSPYDYSYINRNLR